MESVQEDPVLKEYASLAARYDRRWSFYVEATIRETVRQLDARPNDRLLDVGCGTGTLLQVLSLSFPQMQLSGVDPSAEMLSIARGKLGSPTDLKQARAESLPFPDETFDIVVSTSVFHYLRDPHRALRESARVLKPSGRVVITDWCDDYLACRICGIILRLFNRAHFRVYSGKECRELLGRSEFRSVGIERYKIDWLWGLMTAKGQKGA